METGKTSKYLKYAIGEIILVMIGILLALQVNNWNESRKDRKLERSALTALKQNLMTDSLEVYDELIDFKKVHSRIGSLKDFFKGKPVGNIYYQSITSTMLNTFSFVPTKSTFDELQSSGRFNVITNSALTDSIISYYNFIEDGVATFTTSIRTYARSNFAPYLMANYQIEMDYPEDLYPNQPLSIAELDKIKNDLFIKNAINYRSFILKNLELMYQSLIIKIRTLITMIEQEIDDD